MCPEQRPEPDLIDAWLDRHDGPAAFQPASSNTPAYYVRPGGPGLGEPDTYEIVGLSAFDEWQRMAGRSPNYQEKLAKKDLVRAALARTYGDAVVVRTGYGIDPRIGGRRQGWREALRLLLQGDRVDALVIAYHGVGYSDIMQTHHLRNQVAELLAAMGASHIPVRYSRPIGTAARVRATPTTSSTHHSRRCRSAVVGSNGWSTCRTSSTRICETRRSSFVGVTAAARRNGQSLRQ